MSVPVNDVSNLYDSMFNKIKAAYDNLYNGDLIDAETYARLIADATTSLVPVCIKAVQDQVSIDKDNDLKDAQIAGIEEDTLVKKEQVLMSVFERQFIQPKNLEKIETEIDVATRQIVVTEAQSAKDLLVKDKQIAQTEAQTEELLDSTLRANTQLQDALLTSSEQRAGMVKDNEVKSEQVLMSVFERTHVQPKQLEKLETEIDVAERQIALEEAQVTQDLVNKQAQKVLLDSQNLEVLDSIDRANTELEDRLDTSEKQRLQIITQTTEIADSTARANVQLQDQLDTSVLQRTGMTKDNLIKDDSLLTSAKQRVQIDAQTAEIVDSTVRANNQLNDTILTSGKQRVLLDEQKDTADLEQSRLQYEIANLLPQALTQAVLQNTEIADSTERANVQLKDQLDTSAKQRDAISADITVKEKQADSIVIDDGIKKTKMADELVTSAKQQVLLSTEKDLKEEQKKLAYTQRVVADKQAAELGLDEVVKTANVSPETVYTPKYEE